MALRILVVTVMVGSLACREPPETEAFFDWAREHRVPLGDLDGALDAAATRGLSGLYYADLVGLGESRHDTREQLLAKGLLLRGLVRDGGFRVLFLEESHGHVQPLDRYVRFGEGDLEQIMNGLAGWYLWDTVEMGEVIDWLRSFNQQRSVEDRVRVFGVDITAPARSLREVVALLEGGDEALPFEASDLRLDLFEDEFWPRTQERYQEVAEEEVQRLARSIRGLRALLVERREAILDRVGQDAYDAALLHADAAIWGHDFFAGADLRVQGVVRETGMARILLHLLEREGGAKAVLWASNLHVATAPFSMPVLGEGSFEPMGIALRGALGNRYVAVGAAFGSGSFPADLPPGEREFRHPDTESIDGALALVDGAPYALDLSRAPAGSAAARWLERSRVSVAQDASARLVPAAAFDWLVFVPRVHRAQPTSRALESFRALDAR